ncbi:MAG: replication initiation protein [Gammaproteobacteria bacterium]|nr:replication initiation protein [Gammaproteobacteria bacterium]
MSSLITNHKHHDLKKHVNAIHCSNNLTLVQRKLFNALLFHAYPDLPYKQKFEIKGKDLCGLIGYNSKDTAKLKEALIGLITIAIEWNVLDFSTGQEKKWKASSILASAELSNGKCVYEYSQVMKDFLYQPEIYGQINIALISKFKSSYGLALYENCIRYKGLPQTPWLPLDVFKKLMGVFDGKYNVFKDFKKRVLDISVKEVNEITPIRVTPEIERINQKVTRIRFRLEKNIDESPASFAQLSTDMELNQILVDVFGFSKQMIGEIYSKHDLNYIREKIEIITQSESFVTGKIRGLAGYLMEALKKDYKISKSSKLVIAGWKRAEESVKKEKETEERNRMERYKQYKNKKINTYLASLTEEKKSALTDEFDIFMKEQDSTIRMFYKKHNIDHPATKAIFHKFIKDNKQGETGTIISMEEYLELIE